MLFYNNNLLEDTACTLKRLVKKAQTQ